VREIRESQAGPKAVRQAKKMLSDEIEKHAGPEQVRKAGEKSLEPGQTVFVELFKARGKVVSVSKNSVRVELGKVRCEVPLWSVRKSEAEKTEGEAQVRVPEASGKFELNLRGMTREEALEALDLHIDRAFMSGLSIIRIVHGKGSGVLKTAIEEALRADSRVESFKEGAIEEGGWGVTIAKLKT